TDDVMRPPARGDRVTAPMSFRRHRLSNNTQHLSPCPAEYSIPSEDRYLGIAHLSACTDHRSSAAGNDASFPAHPYLHSRHVYAFPAHPSYASARVHLRSADTSFNSDRY